MDISDARVDAAPTRASSAIFVAAAVSIACALLRSPYGRAWEGSELLREIALAAGVLALTIASFLVFKRPRLPYCLALIGGMLASPWLVSTESSLYRYWGANSWTVFNVAEFSSESGAFLVFAKLRILSVALLTIAILCCILRLLPNRLTWRKCRAPRPALVGSTFVGLHD